MNELIEKLATLKTENKEIKLKITIETKKRTVDFIDDFNLALTNEQIIKKIMSKDLTK